MKKLFVILPALLLCSCASRTVISKPDGQLVDEAGRPYTVYKDGKWLIVRPLPRSHILGNLPVGAGGSLKSGH